jgi:hypothetical protein
MKGKNSKLILMWSNPSSKENCKIGILSKQDDGYSFYYLKENVIRAYDDGFTLLAGFPDLDRRYFSQNLFSVFERRIPNKKRKDFRSVVERFELLDVEDLNWEYLRITKGRLATDRLFFLEPIQIIKNMIVVEFEIAGWNYLENKEEVIEKLSVGQCLELLLEPTNPVDPCAVVLTIADDRSTKLGYIPKPYNEYICFWMSRKIKFRAKIRALLDQKQNYRPVVVVNGKLPLERNLKDFLPKIDEFIVKVD